MWSSQREIDKNIKRYSLNFSFGYVCNVKILEVAQISISKRVWWCGMIFTIQYSENRKLPGKHRQLPWVRCMTFVPEEHCSHFYNKGNSQHNNGGGGDPSQSKELPLGRQRESFWNETLNTFQYPFSVYFILLLYICVMHVRWACLCVNVVDIRGQRGGNSSVLPFSCGLRHADSCRWACK